MGKVTLPSNLSNLTHGEFQRFASALLTQLVSEFNGRVEFQKNIRATGPLVVGFTSASDIRGITHGLGIIPNGFLVANLSGPASIYQPSGASYSWTNSTIYLRASAGVTATIFVI